MSYLAIFDLSGIQKFIFATNKLKEIIGASAIVHDVLFEDLPDVLGVSPDSWKDEEKVSFGVGDKVKIVYIGGGNALVLFDSLETFNHYSGMLSKKVFLESGGAIRLFSSCVQLDETQSLNDNQKKLMAKLDEAKKAGGSVTLAPALPVVEVDNNNYEPVIDCGKGVLQTASRYAKLQKADADRIFSAIKPEGVEFAGEIITGSSDSVKRYQAFVHIDGNTMGIRILKFVEGLRGSVWEQLTALRRLSIEITNLYNSTLKDTLAELYEAETPGTIRFRPVIADGDDITVILESRYAFEFVKMFMSKLEGRKIKAFGDDFKPTAAAGIAFATLKYPFSVAYELAEQCCKKAKSETIRRSGGAEAFLRNPLSSVDFQIIYSNIPVSLSDFRDSYFRFGEYSLIRRPYVFSEGCEYSYEAYEKECVEWTDNIESGLIANSKLKGLRNAYGQGTEEANKYASYIRSHATGTRETEIAEKIAAPFNEKKEAKLFDFLDVMDIVWKVRENE